jgi:hypothetical protein
MDWQACRGLAATGLCACLNEARKLRAIHPFGSCKTMAQAFGAQICVVTTKRSVTLAAKALVKLTFELAPPRRRFASTSR